jgi:hypothetical protein
MHGKRPNLKQKARELMRRQKIMSTIGEGATVARIAAETGLTLMRQALASQTRA